MDGDSPQGGTQDDSRKRLAEALGERAAELQGILGRAEGPSDAKVLTELRSAMEKLASAMSVAGLEPCLTSVRRGERILDEALGGDKPSIPASLSAAVDDIVKCLTGAEGDESEPPVEDEEALVSLISQPRRGTAYIVADEHTPMVDSIERELTSASFAPRWVRPGAFEACRGAAVALVDVSAGGDGYSICAKLGRLSRVPRIRILYAEHNTGFDLLRLASSGAQRMIHRPFELRTVLRPEVFDAQVRQAKILVVESSNAEADFVKSALEAAGHVVQVVTDPQRLLEDVVRFRPDMMILEWDLPYVSGIDLTRIVRTDARHEMLPIVFLTRRSEREDRRVAARAGADEYLTKPLTDEELVESVEILLKRNRILRRRLDADGLTDLLNRAAALSATDDLLQSAERKGEFALVGIIDIDHFKRVNDDLGHPTGDRVLREIATHLRASLGAGDVAGRLGGEELLIAFSGPSQDRLIAMLDRLRESLRIELRASDGVFLRRVTFSAGAAIYPTQGTQTAELLGLADLALYEAKTTGRNRVVVASTAPRL